MNLRIILIMEAKKGKREKGKGAGHLNDCCVLVNTLVNMCSLILRV